MNVFLSRMLLINKNLKSIFMLIPFFFFGLSSPSPSNGPVPPPLHRVRDVPVENMAVVQSTNQIAPKPHDDPTVFSRQLVSDSPSLAKLSSSARLSAALLF